MSDILNLNDLLTARGFDTPEARERGLQLLIQAGLTRSGKQAIAASKLAASEAALAAVDLVCADPQCQRLARQQGGREQVVVSPAACSICGGSNTAKGVAGMLAALSGSGVGRLLILGGTPPQHRELAKLLAGSRIELRCIDGSSGAHTTDTARANLDWADLTIIWSSTPLAHKVTQSYTNTAKQRGRCRQITVARRSLGALCEAVVEHVRQRGS